MRPLEPRTGVASDSIVIRGAREHNLKNVSLELPRDRLIVFTGLSGSGKSSLAFDTIYAEGQRRYVESLSAYARQFLGQMEKPDVDFIEGLSPAISIDQKTASRNPRSTVGTVTEIHDYLRLLYARAGIPHCPQCGRVVARQTPQQIVDRILELPDGARFQVLAPVVRGRKGEYESLLKELSREGFSRARIDGEVRDLAEEIRLDRYYQHSIDVIVDRLVRKDGIERRLTDSLETALRLADGVAVIDVEGEAPLTFSQHFACDHCGISFEELQPRNFSFNNPYGACAACNGIGTRFQVDWRLAIPNPDKAISEGAIIPWGGRHRATYYSRMLEGVAAKHGLDLDRPFSRMPKQHQDLVLEGTGTEPITVTYTNRFGKERRYQTTYEGLVPWLVRRHENADGDGAREFYQQYMRQVPCETCEGARLNPVALAVEIGGLNIHQVSSQSLRKASEFLDRVELDDRQARIAAAVLKEIQARPRFLLDVGLDYLTLSRSAATLAGGEAQRIRLATQIGSGLVGVLYILDEPSIGLHQRDNQRLIET
ncbi:MAG: excinuclease ABC subunit A, partial [Actinobacteria bacterium]|nr:excinuclease ABC subunit A [Actinomycetota bacterium]